MQQTKKGKRKNLDKLIYKILLFTFSAILLTYIFPREAQFRYSFQEGKPWRYELLTAPFDFPIYKSEEVIKNEKDSIIRNFQPYYKLSEDVKNEQIDKLWNDYNSFLNKTVSSPYVQYVEKELRKIYDIGVMKAQVIDSLREQKVKSVRVAEGKIYKSRSLDNVYTAITAYEQILNNAPVYLDKKKLQATNIQNYISEDLFYDQETSDKMLLNLTQQLSTTYGLVQSGERIIDKGEIISSRTYDILLSLKTVMDSNQKSKKKEYSVYLGQFLIISLFLLALFLFLYLFRRRTFSRMRDVVFILIMVLVLVVSTSLAARFGTITVYLVPYAILPIILCTFFDSRTALFTHIITVIICSFLTPFPFEFLALQLAAGMTVLFSLRDLTQRSQLMTCAIYVFAAYCLIYTSIILIQGGDWTRLDLKMYVYLLINSGLLLFAYLLIYIFERTFGYISNVSLIELQNINNQILRKLSEVSPGTFQHSLQVGTLGYEAAKEINANAQLVRTGAFYHDIGKMKNPAYFVENQVGVNPHEHLSYEESAQIIIGHVAEGVAIAEKNNLPKPIINFIRTHHGRNKARYFYNSYKNKYPDREIDESLFTYPGPIPFSKETAILMMADSVEAGSRSLKEYTEESISILVEKIIDGQIAEGAFKNSPITFKDVERVKVIFKNRLKIIYHSRITYPELVKTDDVKPKNTETE